jgi:hypothetical protein
LNIAITRYENPWFPVPGAVSENDMAVSTRRDVQSSTSNHRITQLDVASFGSAVRDSLNSPAFLNTAGSINNSANWDIDMAQLMEGAATGVGQVGTEALDQFAWFAE